MINSISVDNFRSLCNINNIEIKPITVLLGKNSCGKSSFLRIFPLLKQSINTKVRGAISLFGDLVDFGEMSTVLNNSTNEKKDYILFGFKGIIRKTPLIRSRTGSRIIISEDLNYSISIKIKKYEEEDYLYISEMELEYGVNKIFISSNAKTRKISKLEINGISFTNKFSGLRLGYFFLSSLFPEFFYEIKNENFFGNPVAEILHNINKNFDNLFSEFQLHKIIQELSLNSANNLQIDEIKKILENDSEKCLLLEEKINNKPEILDNLRESLILRDFINLYDILISDICNDIANICYSKPLRANTERFYRHQPLSVNEVEPDGSNLVQFYSTMSNKQKSDFHSWMDKNFDFHYEIEKKTSFQSIIIKDSKTGEEHNINDMGFGFTQILPIVTQEWSLMNKPNNPYRKKDTIFAIEQPELHLHPAFQCKLIKAFANSIKMASENELSIRFILETHSETIVNYLGKLIERDEIKAEDISVLIFTKENNITEISQSSFNEQGILTNWPIGFFGE